MLRRQTDSCSQTRQRVPPIVHEVLKSGGTPLDAGTRAYMEPRFGQDFSRVRVHTDIRASEAARDVHARAFTVGHGVVFASGAYMPRSAAGKRLLAHELTHVVQQGGTVPGQGGYAIGSSDDRFEREADAIADRILQSGGTGRALPAVGATELRLQRTPAFKADCNQLQRCDVVEALPAARQYIDGAIGEVAPVASGAVTAGRIVDLLNVHFHVPTPENVATILDNYRQIRGTLDAPLDYHCYGYDNDQCKSDKGVVGALSDCNGEVDICPDFHNLRCEERARLLVHELTHETLGDCNDYAYVHEDKYMYLTTEQAMSNADTYAQFAKLVLMATPSCKDCSDILQKPGAPRY